MMDVGDLLRELDFGKSVAEFDEGLDRYFVDTEVFRGLISGTFDIVAGDKGTGKTALYRVLRKRYGSIPALAKTEIVTGFNITGNPVFQQLVHLPSLSEGQYRSIWKTYIFSLVANWLVHLYEGHSSTEISKVAEILETADLNSFDDSAETVFSKIVKSVMRLVKPKSVEAEIGFSETGLPVVKPKLEFRDAQARSFPHPEVEEVPYEEALRQLDVALKEADITVWVALDRLDEAFQGFGGVEVPALRALFRTYLDLQNLTNLKLKLFVRKDLFRKITDTGFVNLSHINSQKIEIVWDEKDLIALLVARVRDSAVFRTTLGLAGSETDDEVFYRIFPAKVDQGARKSNTWNWIMARIRDGNNIKPPRNLIDLVEKARQAQLRDEQRTRRKVEAGEALMQPDAVRKAQKQLSEQRVQDTLLAESPELQSKIELFRNGKAEHNRVSIAAVLGIQAAEVPSTVRPLQEIGFIEEVGANYKIPMLYRDGLSITQGKAFDDGTETLEEQDD